MSNIQGAFVFKDKYFIIRPEIIFIITHESVLNLCFLLIYDGYMSFCFSEGSEM